MCNSALGLQMHLIFYKKKKIIKKKKKKITPKDS